MTVELRRQEHAPAPGARTGGRPLYAIGDVHGCYDLFRALLEAIAQDAADRHPGELPLLVLCGDYVDRGPDSAKVLAALAWLMRSSAIEARALEGNHESILRQFLLDPADHAPWLGFGGRETLASYGIAVAEEIDGPAALVGLRDALLDAMPASHHLLLERLETMVEVGDYVFVHAGVMPGVPLARQRADDLLWIREPFLDHPRPLAAPTVVVHGHTWDDEQATVLPHRLGIDTGAYATGVLTGLRIADDAIEVIQAVRTAGG